MFNQRAYVAHHSEPLFCRNDSSSLLLPGPSTTLATNYDANDGRDEASEDENEAGRVAIFSAEDHLPRYDVNDTHVAFASLQSPYDSATGVGIYRQYQMDSILSATATASEPTSSSHVQDLSSSMILETRHDEDIHRLLSESAHNVTDEEPRAGLAASVIDALESSSPEGLSRSDSHLSLYSSIASYALPRRVDQRPQHQQTARWGHISASFQQDETNAATPNALLGTVRQARSRSRGPRDFALDPIVSDVLHESDDTGTRFDEDVMAVDDPRRNYDFADFMDLWRLRSIKDQLLPKFPVGKQPSVRLGRPVKPLLKRDISSGALDVQCMRWQIIGPSREQAKAARTLLHPSPPTVLYHSRRGRGQQQNTKHYQFRSFAPRHKASVCHYQLRNVLAATSRSAVLYATGGQVECTPVACPDIKQTVMDLATPSYSGFRITCLSASSRCRVQDYGIAIAGGYYGEYAICNLDALEPGITQGFVTQAYNGLVTHIHTVSERRSGLPQAVMCSNDRKVRLMDVSTLQFTDDFAYENAINCASTSPDGRLRALVGDSQETLITNAETGQTLVTLRLHGDHGFACDWARNGIHVATAAQDGGILIWDARNWAAPCQSWGSSMSCARSVQWTDTGALVVAENDDIVKVYDGAVSEDFQELSFFGSIAGVAVVNGGDELVIANADKTVGGLLCYERTAQGRGACGSYGKAVDRGRRSSPTRREQASDSLADIVI